MTEPAAARWSRSASLGAVPHRRSAIAARARRATTSSDARSSPRSSSRWSWRATSASACSPGGAGPHNRVGRAHDRRRLRRLPPGADSRPNASLLFTIGARVRRRVYLVVAVHMAARVPDRPARTTRARARPHRRRLRRRDRRRRCCISLFSRDVRLRRRVDHPDNAFLITDSADGGRDVVDVVAGAHRRSALIARDRRRSSSAAGARRRPARPPALAPVLFTGAVAARRSSRVLARLSTSSAGGDDAEDGVDLAMLLAFAALPFAFLAGLLRSRAWRAGAVTELVESARRGARARRAARRAAPRRSATRRCSSPTGCPSARPLRRRRRAAASSCPPTDDPARAATEVERDGRRVGALVHDRALCEEPELVRDGRGAAALALDNERLDAELRARVEELQRLAPAAARGRAGRAPAPRARPARRRAAAARRALAAARPRPRAARRATRTARQASCSTARATRRARRSRTCASSPAASTRPCSPTAASARRSRRWPTARRCRSRSPRVPEERLPGAGRGRRLLRRRRVADERRQVRAGQRTPRCASAARTAARSSRSATTASAAPIPAAGTGLRGLADRLAALDGRLEIESEPGRGTAVRARVPAWPIR